MQVTDKQRKLIWVGAALIGAYYLIPPIINTVRGASPPPPAVEAKPSPVRAIVPPPPPPSPADPAVLKAAATTAAFDKLAGNWFNAAVLPYHGLCRIGLQIKTVPDKPGTYTGYSTTTCNPYIALTGKPATRANIGQANIESMAPTSIIMTGDIENGAIVFRIDRNIGIPPDGCAITGFNVSPFAEQIAAQWQAGTCRGGQMILNRVSNLR
jgi:hypothetical protein